MTGASANQSELLDSTSDHVRGSDLFPAKTETLDLVIVRGKTDHIWSTLDEMQKRWGNAAQAVGK